MPLRSLPTTPCVNEEIEHEHTPTVDYLQFGDGYMQRYVNGINAETNTFTLRYTNLTKPERDIIYNFVRSTKGAEAFLYRMIYETADRKFICPEGIRQTHKSGNYFDLEFTIQEVFDAN